MLKLVSDENFNGDILRGLYRQRPDLDVVRVRRETRESRASSSEPKIVEVLREIGDTRGSVQAN